MYWRDFKMTSPAKPGNDMLFYFYDVRLIEIDDPFIRR